MRKELHHTDISNTPELLRLAHEVQRTGITQVLRAGDEEIAVLAPAQPKKKRRSQPKQAGSYDSLLSLKGMFAGDEPDDVSQNVDRYLAQASYEEFHPPKTR